MNTNDPWKKLSDDIRAHQEPAGAQDETVPHGFCSRVLARVRPQREMTIESWFRLAVRALPLAAVVLVICWISLPAPNLSTPPEPDADLVEMALAEAWP